MLGCPPAPKRLLLLRHPLLPDSACILNHQQPQICSLPRPPRTPPPHPAGLPELPVPRPEQVAQFNVAARCEEESRRQTESYAWGDQTYTTLAPAANEQHCQLREYYCSKHPRCLEQLNHFMEADLRLLMGGPVMQGGGLSGGGGSSSGSSSSRSSGSSSSGSDTAAAGEELEDRR